MAIGIEAIFLDEIKRATGCIEPLLTAFYVVVGKGTHEGETPLEPHALRGVHQASVAVQAGVHSPILLVPAVLHPKWHDVVEQFVLVLICPLLEV